LSSGIIEKSWGFFTLSRPVNVVIAGLSILVAAFISGPLQPLGKVLAACFSGALITAAANAINDYFDLDIDRINKPERPLPKAVLSKKEALLFSLFFFFSGIVLGAFINRIALAIAASTSVLLYLYSAKLKRTVLWGNLTVSLATALAFIYGGLAVGNPTAAMIPAGFAFAMHLGREIIKDMEDVEGDRQYQSFTLPVKHGITPAKWMATVVFFVLFCATFLPHVLNIYGSWYLIIVIVGVNSVLVYTVISMWRRSSRNNFRRLSAYLKVDMIMGLLAIYAGRW